MGCDELKRIRVKNAASIDGTIKIQGSKNTVLPIMAATLLSSGVSVIYNCPNIEDVKVMCQLLECLHARTYMVGNTLTIDTTKVRYAPLPCELTTRLRSSVLLLGPILARWNKVELGVPGGCAIGLRPIDIHLEGFMKMNVNIACQADILIGNTYHLQGCDMYLRFPSVGATENLIMAAVLAKGRTVLRGVAKEPEIVELCNYLVSMGALIEGVGTDTLIIKGTSVLEASDYCNVFDRIVAGTYLLMAAAIPSNLVLSGIDDIHYIKNIIDVVARLGVSVIRREDCLKIRSVGYVQGGCFETGIYPEFPTDLLSVLIVVLATSKESSKIKETIFESRLSVVEELKKAGANFQLQNSTVYLQGRDDLQGCEVMATDLRQGAALVVLGVLSKGCTVVDNISYIQRGYEDIVRDLHGVGVEIEYI